MTIALACIGVALALGIAAGLWEDDPPLGFGVFLTLAAVILGVWGVVHFPMSSYNRANCERVADGYQLEYDWSIRSNCRLYLPSGQLVPEDRVRITSDGQIIVSDGDS